MKKRDLLAEKEALENPITIREIVVLLVKVSVTAFLCGCVMYLVRSIF